MASLLRGLAGSSASRVTQLTVSQLNNYNRFKRKLPTGAGKITIEKIRGGGRRFSADVPARNIPGSFARYIKEVDAGGRTLRYVKETYDAHGRIVHVKPKF